jgi:hypothetical protein
MPDLQMSRVVFRMAMNAGGADGWRWDLGFVAKLGFLVLLEV